MAKHSTPRRRSGKHWVGTLLTAGAVVACMGLLLRFLPVGTIPTGGDEPSDSAVSSTEPAASSVPEPEPEPVVETLRFSATGDDLIHSPIYKQAARRAANGQQYDFDYCYAQVAPFYAQQDINWINQETLCSDELEPSSYPCFSTPGDCARALYRAGIRVFSLSNNHTYDKGAAGLAATLRFWESMPEDVVTTGLWRGADDYSRIPLQTVNGVTIAYLSYTEHTNGIPTSSSMPANVIYTSQTDVIEQQVRAADGRQTFVAYSLGNFLSTQNQPDQLVGAILNLQLQKTTEPDGTVQCAVLEPKLLPTVTHYDAGKSNVRTYLFRDYTQELAKQHGVRAKHSDFSLDTVQKIAQNNISSDFLELT